MTHDVAANPHAPGFQHLIGRYPESGAAINLTGGDNTGFRGLTRWFGHENNIAEILWLAVSAQLRNFGPTVSPAILPAMASKAEIAVVGPGRLGTALALELKRAGYRVREVISRNNRASRKRAQQLAKRLRAHASSSDSARIDAPLIWFCVPDREIAEAARELAHAAWKGKIAFHSSGALASDELDSLRRRGASVAAVHPMMTFVRGSVPALQNVPFALEGDAAAVRVARRIVKDLGGRAFSISKKNKAAYHAWGGFISPLLVLTLVAGEKVARLAGFSAEDSRKKMLPIVRQTLANYAKLGPAAAFTGPIGRGDVATVRKHLRVLKTVPEAREVYVALARIALRHLPVQNRKELGKLLRASRL
jgi:predicted short-subunit dehydrogenase-like oxidoreductase (DUF2520 family)